MPFSIDFLTRIKNPPKYLLFLLISRQWVLNENHQLMVFSHLEIDGSLAGTIYQISSMYFESLDNSICKSTVHIFIQPLDIPTPHCHGFKETFTSHILLKRKKQIHIARANLLYKFTNTRIIFFIRNFGFQ